MFTALVFGEHTPAELLPERPNLPGQPQTSSPLGLNVPHP
jgi:hypothetical protein